MSGIVAIFARDGSRAAPRAGFSAMMDALSHRGPDGSRWCAIGPLVVGHHHFETTPEELGESQPLQGDGGRFCVALDGRLDNRQELLNALGSDAPQGESESLSDAELLLAAYGKWGREGFGRLLGSFAFLLFDKANRELLLVRDPLGDRTLFYSMTKELFLVASEEAAILRHPAISGNLDEDRLARYFAVSELRDGSTFFAEVREVLPAHWISLSPRGVASHRYWEPHLTERIRYRDDREYGEHFRQLLGSAVDCRLRSTVPAAVQMSGGLDSTGLAALAAQSSAAPSHRSLKTFSWVFDELKSCDERVYMDSMVDRYGLTHHRVVGDRAWPLSQPESTSLNPNTPEDTAYRPLVEQLYGRARQEGARVLLTGMFGDHLFSGFEAWLTENLVSGRWYRAAGEVGWYLSHRRWRQLRPAVGYPLLRWKRFRRAWSGPRSPWLTPSAARARLTGGDWSPASGRPARQVQLRNVLGLLGAHGISAEAFYASRYGLELRHPYRDRRLIEFMLSIPADQLYRRGLLKWILRVGLKEDLPEIVRRRPGATSLWPLFQRGLQEKEKLRVREILSSEDRQWSRYVKEAWLQERWPSRSDTDPSALVTWLCLSFELWRSQLQGGNSNSYLERVAV
ncbi:MAG: hypothetical protein K0U98_16490 [Deltaproteobacteria bacterium]|nr:hypothetical protein [Deltaproteobacteria bacterium]